ncbi:MAG: OmpA family protein [Acidobacteriota bacterium]
MGEIVLERGAVLDVTMRRHGWFGWLGGISQLGGISRLGGIGRLGEISWGWDKVAMVTTAAGVVLAGYFVLTGGTVTIDSFVAEPAKIEQDQSATLRWETLHSAEVTLNGNSVPESGTSKVHPKKTTEYTLVARNHGVEQQRTLTVEVSVPKELADGLVRQFMKVYTELKDSPIGDELLDSEHPSGFLAAAGSENQLVDQRCRQGALDFAVDTLRAHQQLESQNQAEQLFQEHMQEQRQAMSHASYREIFKHIVECKDYCRPWFTQLLQCHVLSVADRDPGIVLFPTNSRSVPAKYAQGLLAEVAKRATQDPAAQIWLMGRASKIGARDYNRTLSFGRAASVKEVLVNDGVSPARIEILAFGYEPPQITQQVAKQYDREALYLAEGEQLMNQSVVVVLYSPRRLLARISSSRFVARARRYAG